MEQYSSQIGDILEEIKQNAESLIQDKRPNDDKERLLETRAFQVQQVNPIAILFSK